MGTLGDWNELVQENLKIDAFAVETLPSKKGTTSVSSDGRYNLLVGITNSKAENMFFKNTEIRVQGDASQVEFFSDDTFTTPLAPDYEGKPRVHYVVPHLSPGESTCASLFFKARKSMPTKQLKFVIGVYSDIQPHGFYWAKDTPNY